MSPVIATIPTEGQAKQICAQSEVHRRHTPIGRIKTACRSRRIMDIEAALGLGELYGLERFDLSWSD
ncbi:unnamed protein product [Calypogeia fissa]